MRDSMVPIEKAILHKRNKDKLPNYFRSRNVTKGTLRESHGIVILIH